MPKFKNFSEVTDDSSIKNNFIGFSNTLETDRIRNQNEWFRNLSNTNSSEEIERLQQEGLSQINNILDTISNDLYECDEEASPEMIDKLSQLLHFEKQTPEETQEKKQVSHDIKVAGATANAKFLLIDKLCNSPMNEDDPNYLPQLDRTESMFLYFDFSKEGIEKNREVRRILKTGTIEEKREFISKRLNEFADEKNKIDFNTFDLTDFKQVPKFIGDNPSLFICSAELARMMRMGEDVGCDFHNEKGMEMAANLKLLAELSFNARTKVDVAGSPAFDQLPLDRIDFNSLSMGNLYSFTNIENDNKVEIKTADEIDGIDEDYLTQLFNLNDLCTSLSQESKNYKVNDIWTGLGDSLAGYFESEKNTLFDKNLQPLERPQKFINDFKAKTNDEFMPTLQRVIYDNNGNPILNTESVMQETEELIAELQKIDPTFAVTPEEKKNLFSPQRLQNFILANNTIADFKKFSLSDRIKLPDAFSGISNAILKKDGSESSRRYNEELKAKLVGTDLEAHTFRKETIKNALNMASDIDVSKLNPDLGDEAVFNECIKNYDNFKIASEFGNITSNLGTADLKFTDEMSEIIEEKKSTIEKVGKGALDNIKMHADELYLSFPIEKVNGELADKMIKSGNPKLKQIGLLSKNVNNGMEAISQIETSKTIKNELIAPIQSVDIVNDKNTREFVIESCGDIKKYLKEEYQKLKNADHIYNFNNSKQYKKMLTTLEKADKLLDTMGGGMTEKEQQDLFDALFDVKNAASDYIRYKQNTEMKGITQDRFQCANNLVNFTNRIVATNVYSTSKEEARKNDAVFNKFVQTDAKTEGRRLSGEEQTKENVVVDSETLKKEQLFEALLNKNRGERGKLEKIPQNNMFKFPQSVLCEAREELTNKVGRRDMSESEITASKMLMATVIGCMGLMNKNTKPEQVSEGAIRDLSKAIFNSESFQKLTKEVNSDKIMDFLGNGMAEKILKECQPEIDKIKKGNNPVASNPEPEIKNPQVNAINPL